MHRIAAPLPQLGGEKDLHPSKIKTLQKALEKNEGVVRSTRGWCGHLTSCGKDDINEEEGKGGSRGREEKSEEESGAAVTAERQHKTLP